MAPTMPDFHFKAPHKSAPAQAYWEGAARGELVLQHCEDCNAITHPPNVVCTTCLSPHRRFEAACGLGDVYSYTVTYRPMNEAFAGDVPYTLAYVRLDEGVTVVTWLRDVEPGDDLIGKRVRAVFEQVDPDTWLHRFVPVEDVATA